MVVPGSGLVRAQAEEEGLAQIFIDAGFEWRLSGLLKKKIKKKKKKKKNMCLAMNPGQLAPGERGAATSNRNFEGRQGRGGRTHLNVRLPWPPLPPSPGRLTDVRDLWFEPA